MTPLYSRFGEFHEFSKRFQKIIPKDWREWPKEWNVKEIKSYPRFPQIKLPLPAVSAKFNLEEVLRDRESRSSSDCSSMGLEALGTILGLSLGVRATSGETSHHRPYPSAGGRYPLEGYLVTPGSSFLAKGIYHYDPLDHALEVLPILERDEVIAQKLFSEEKGVFLILTATFERITRKYGERGYRFALLEAGHVAQNIYLVGEALNLAIMHRGLLLGDDRTLEKLLGIDGFLESVVATLVVGDRGV